MAKAVCLVSGGMDSCVSAAVAHSLGHEPAFLHLTYGQRTAARELRAFHEIADYYRVKRRLVGELSHLAEIGGSALTDPGLELPEGEPVEGEIPVSYVPFRNANLLAFATSWAEVLGARFLFIGAVEEDSSGYPDCRRVFFEAFNAVIRLGTRPGTRIEIVTPLISLKKKEIVLKGVELNAPLHLTWSCYRSEDVACGTCASCFLRLQAFRGAAVEDPLPYRSG